MFIKAKKTMKTRAILLIIILSLYGCSSRQKQVNYVLYEKSPMPGLRADKEIYKDLFFTLSIPERSKYTDINSTSSYYYDQLNFGKNEAIITLYFPRATRQFDTNIENVTSDYFKKTLIDIDLLDIISSNIKIKKNRRFSIRSIKPNMLIMYINIKEKNTPVFKHSINSIKVYDTLDN